MTAHGLDRVSSGFHLYVSKQNSKSSSSVIDSSDSGAALDE